MILKALHILFESGRYFEDILWTPQILYLANKVVTVPNIYYYYFRDNKFSIVKLTKKNKKLQEDKKYSRKFLNEFLKQKNLKLNNFIRESKTYKFCGIRILKTEKVGNIKKFKLLGFINWETLSPCDRVS